MTIPDVVSAATGTIIETGICGELTVVKHHKHYLVAQWHKGAVFEKGEKVSSDDLNYLGVKVLENTDGLLGEYYFVDKIYPFKNGLPQRGGKTKRRLSITCSSSTGEHRFQKE